MSGGLLRGLSFLSCVRGSTRCAPLYQFQPTRRAGYIVLLPEIPDDTPETNILLRVPDKVPQYNGVTAEMAYRAIGKLLIEYESGLLQLEDRIQDPNYPKTFESVFEPIEKLTAPLDCAWALLKNLYLVRNEDGISKVYNRLQKRVEKAQRRRFFSGPIFRVIKDLHGDLDKYDNDQQQAIGKYYGTCKGMGLDLDQPTRELLESVFIMLNRQCERYKANLEQSTAKFKHPFDDNLIRSLPEHLRQHFATQNGFLVTLHEPQYSTFMAYCGDRMQRWNLYNARMLRSAFTNADLNNSIPIEEIRGLRQQQAEVFGFKTYTEMSLLSKVTPSATSVKETLRDLAKKIDPLAKSQIAELQTFCAEKGFKATLELWDMSYWRRRYRETRLAIDEKDIRQLFLVDSVLQGIGNILETFFGVEMREVKPKEPLWSPDVKMFRVAVDGKEMGTILMDLPGDGNKFPGSWCQPLTGRCAAAGLSPVVSIIMSLNDRTSVSPSELGDLLGLVGQALQLTLSQARYLDVSTDLPWDASSIPKVFEMLMLDRRFARMLSTKQELPDDYHSKLVDSHLHLSAVDLQQEVYFSLLDFELYSKPDFWQNIVKELRPEIVTAFPHHKHNVYHLCQFSEIITGNLAGGYFVKIWNRMIAAEMFHAIHECQSDSDLVSVGKSFRDHMLLTGGCISYGEGFRRFRGRDPASDSLLAISGLVDVCK